MKLEIDRIPEAGNLQKERVVMKASEDLDIGKYILLRSKKGSSGNPKSGSKTAYWLPDVSVKAGDLVVVYSKQGKSSKKTLDDGRVVHFYYWQLNKAIWGAESNNTAVLLNVREWRHKSP
ncbi:hypothetical protein [Pseudomonas sp. RW10S2]|uniref:hypothetical protein n=1 Tax=Pseudomonas sp. RW10S2 TaxID=459637 RepID=UPI0016445FC1|nr:hypothetical protein [Pseudomonas sp. RW10S2]MBC3464991.1 hypothetical protein [Pseudomonas sp. RW10S2]